MKLSRCSCLGLLAVSAGTATALKYHGGGGLIDMRSPEECSGFPMKLSLRGSLEEVEKTAKERYTLGVKSYKDVDRLFTSAATSAVTKIDDKMFSYRKDDTTAMLYDRGSKELVAYTSAVPNRHIFMSLMIESTGEYALIGNNGVGNLKNFPGLTVCIDDSNARKEFTRLYEKEDVWAKQFQDVFMKDLMVKIREAGDSVMTVRVDTKGYKLGDAVIEVKGNDITVRTMTSEWNNYLPKIQRLAKDKELVFGKGCMCFFILSKTSAVNAELVVSSS
eukprot:GHVS01002160.1.p1 GENE.GHVS01002160.1~~GHVS01002160.1.p1  ORF type:complete len:276 (+),score=25.97 GHVS01002160.1:200-1027(+)